MNFICPRCGKILDRDMRKRESKFRMTERGYSSFCGTVYEYVYCRPEKLNRRKVSEKSFRKEKS